MKNINARNIHTFHSFVAIPHPISIIRCNSVQYYVIIVIEIKTFACKCVIRTYNLLLVALYSNMNSLCSPVVTSLMHLAISLFFFLQRILPYHLFLFVRILFGNSLNTIYVLNGFSCARTTETMKFITFSQCHDIVRHERYIISDIHPFFFSFV